MVFKERKLKNDSNGVLGEISIKWKKNESSRL